MSGLNQYVQLLDLAQFAKETLEALEKRRSRRPSASKRTTLKKWEAKMLRMANEALAAPAESSTARTPESR